MKIFTRTVLFVIGGLLLLGSTNQALAAVNTAEDGGSAISLGVAASVTVNLAAAPGLVKQVYVGGVCLASSDISGGAYSCGTPSTASITVPATTALEFLIFVRNESDIALNDVRFIDNIDDSVTGFTYAGPNSITATPIASLPADTAGAGAIYTSASTGTGQSDAVDTGAGNYASITDQGDAADLDYVTVGAVALPIVQVNETLNIPARSTFAILIPVTKN